MTQLAIRGTAERCVDQQRFVVLLPGMRLVTLSNGPQFVRFARHRALKAQKKIVTDALNARSLTCPFRPPMDVIITRCAPGTMDSDNLMIAAKGVRDAIAAWIGINDRYDALVRYEVRQQKHPPGEYAVRIEIMQRRIE